MSLPHEFDILKHKIFICLLLFIIASFFLFFFAVKITYIDIPFIGITLPIPSFFLTLIPTKDTISMQFLTKIQNDLLPAKIELIIINPLNVVIAQICISLFLGFISVFPLILYQFISYLSPALKKKERKMIILSILPSFLLFIAGCLFSYLFFLPFTFKILYSYIVAVGVRPFFEISQFISLSIVFTLVCGLIFLLPVFMTGLSALDVIDASVWKKNWHIAFIVFTIFSAIITPDNTGISMIFITITLAILFILGYYGSRIVSKKLIQ